MAVRIPSDSITVSSFYKKQLTFQPFSRILHMVIQVERSVICMTKSEYIAQKFRDTIARGEWRAGEKIPSESQLCSLFNVSRMSIRSAINTLVAQGLLVSYRGKGTFVCDTDLNSASTGLLTRQSQISRTDMFEFRRIIEIESVGLAAVRADTGTMQELERLAKSLQYAADLESALEADMGFHYAIARATKNAVIAETFDLLRESYRQMFIENIGLRGAAGATEHLQIVFAIESRNPELARQYMAEHLNKSMEKAVENFYRSSAQ